MNNRRSFIVGIKSIVLSNKEINFLKKYKPWGVILFTRNIKNISQTQKLTSNIRKIFKDKNYPILIDQEGGRVNRLKNIITFDNLTSEFFGKKFLRNDYEFKVFFKLFEIITKIIPRIKPSIKPSITKPCKDNVFFLFRFSKSVDIKFIFPA